MKKISINKTDMLLFFFLLGNIFAWIFSENQIISFWGVYQNEGSHLLAVLSYIGLAFIFNRFSQKTKKQTFYYLVAGTTIASLYALYQFMNMGGRPSGLEGQPILSAGVITLGLIAFFLADIIVFNRKNHQLVLTFIIASIHLFALAVLDSTIAWISLIVSILLITYIKKKKFIHKQLKRKKSFAFILITCGFLVSGMMILQKEQFSINQRLNQLQTVGKMFRYEYTQKESIKDVLIGHGQYMSGFNFFRHKDPSFNLTNEWTWRLSRIQNQYLELLFTIGMVGLLPWLILLRSAYRTSLKRNTILSIGVLYVIIWQFFYYLVPTLYLLSLCVIVYSLGYTKEKVIAKISPLVVILVLLRTGLGFGYSAGIIYAGENELKANSFQTATEYVPYYDEYYRLSALTKINIAKNCNDNASLYCSAAQQQICNIPLLYSEAQKAAKKAVDISPQDPDNWESYGIVLFKHSLENNIRDKNLQEEALEAFTKAHELDPVNPKYLDDIGQVYLDQKKYDKAEKHFMNAIELKPDYIASYNHLIEIYKQLEDTDNQKKIETKLKKL